MIDKIIRDKGKSKTSFTTLLFKKKVLSHFRNNTFKDLRNVMSNKNFRQKYQCTAKTG